MPFGKLFWAGPLAGAAALAFTGFQIWQIRALPPGPEETRDLTTALNAGVRAFWRRLLLTALPLYLIGAVLLLLLRSTGVLHSTFAPLALLVGGGCGAASSALACWASVRVGVRLLTQVQTSSEQAFHTALRSGMVSGFSAAGIALLILSSYPLFLYGRVGSDPTLAGQSLRVLVLGALLWMLLAHFGGGIFARSARITSGDQAVQERAFLADLTGRCVTAAGINAQLFACLLSAMLGAYTLGGAVFLEDAAAWNALLLPLLVLSLGTLCSLFGTLILRYEQRGSLHSALLKSAGMSTLLTAALSAPVTYLLLGSWRLYLALAAGLLASFLLQFSTRHFLADHRRPHRSLQAAAQSGGLPLCVLFLSILAAFLLARSAHGVLSPLQGAYGVALTAVGFLAPMGLILSIVASSPACDTLAALVGYLPCDATIRARTDALMARGSTSASNGRAYALGGCFLAGCALSGACGCSLISSGQSLMALPFWVGMVAGFLLAGTLSSLSLTAGFTTVRLLRTEYRRNGKRSAKSLSICVDLGLRSALCDVALPALITLLTPLLTGWLLGARGAMGLTLGGVLFGGVLAIVLPSTRFLWPWSKAPNGRAVALPLRRTSGPVLVELLLFCTASALLLGLTGAWS